MEVLKGNVDVYFSFMVIGYVLYSLILRGFFLIMVVIKNLFVISVCKEEFQLGLENYLVLDSVNYIVLSCILDV